MNTFRAELHVHTVLSPWADIEMTPPLIVQEASSRGINIIAITDHNSSANITAVQKAAQGSGIFIIPGMELQTKEEVHVLCLFDNLEQIEALQRDVSKRMARIENQPDHYGEQFVVDEAGNYIRRESQLLISSADISIQKACEIVHNLGGLFIPAHVNRSPFGLIENLGFVPSQLKVDALEISRHISVEKVLLQFPQLKNYPIIQNGDVHRLDALLGFVEYHIESPTIEEIKKAFQGVNERFFKILSIR